MAELQQPEEYGGSAVLRQPSRSVSIQYCFTFTFVFTLLVFHISLISYLLFHFIIHLLSLRISLELSFLYSHSHYFSLYLLPYLTLPPLYTLIFHNNSTLPIDIIAIYAMLITVWSFCSVNFGPLIDCCTTQIEGSLKYHVNLGGDSIDDDSTVSTPHLCVNSPK